MKSKLFFLFLITYALTCLGCNNNNADFQSNSIISGFVEDDPIQNAKIVLKNSNGEELVSTQTDQIGEYSLQANLKINEKYTLEATGQIETTDLVMRTTFIFDGEEEQNYNINPLTELQYRLISNGFNDNDSEVLIRDYFSIFGEKSLKEIKFSSLSDISLNMKRISILKGKSLPIDIVDNIKNDIINNSSTNDYIYRDELKNKSKLIFSTLNAEVNSKITVRIKDIALLNSSYRIEWSGLPDNCVGGSIEKEFTSSIPGDIIITANIFNIDKEGQILIDSYSGIVNFYKFLSSTTIQVENPQIDNIVNLSDSIDVFVPQNTLSGGEQLVFKEIETNSIKDLKTFVFEPSGMTFQNPIEIKYLYNPAIIHDPRNIIITRISDNDKIDILKTKNIDYDNHIISFETEHFSTYSMRWFLGGFNTDSIEAVISPKKEVIEIAIEDTVQKLELGNEAKTKLESILSDMIAKKSVYNSKGEKYFNKTLDTFKQDGLIFTSTYDYTLWDYFKDQIKIVETIRKAESNDYTDRRIAAKQWISGYRIEDEPVIPLLACYSLAGINPDGEEYYPNPTKIGDTFKTISKINRVIAVGKSIYGKTPIPLLLNLSSQKVFELALEIGNDLLTLSEIGFWSRLNVNEYELKISDYFDNRTNTILPIDDEVYKSIYFNVASKFPDKIDSIISSKSGYNLSEEDYNCLRWQIISFLSYISNNSSEDDNYIFSNYIKDVEFFAKTQIVAVLLDIADTVGELTSREKEIFTSKVPVEYYFGDYRRRNRSNDTISTSNNRIEIYDTTDSFESFVNDYYLWIDQENFEHNEYNIKTISMKIKYSDLIVVDLTETAMKRLRVNNNADEEKFTRQNITDLFVLNNDKYVAPLKSIFVDLNTQIFDNKLIELSINVDYTKNEIEQIYSNNLEFVTYNDLENLDSFDDNLSYSTLISNVKDAQTNNPIELASVYIEELQLERDTNEDGMFTFYKLVPGDYTILVFKSGYKPIKSQVSIMQGEVKQFEAQLILDDEVAYTEGYISGIVKDAHSGDGVSNVTINIREGGNASQGEIIKTISSSFTGDYTLTTMAGVYTLEIMKENYHPVLFTVVIIGGTEQSKDVSISKLLEQGEMRIVLTWGATPNDLDSHLVKYTDNNEDYHIYFSQKTSINTDDNLDVDDTSSFGPETITIKNIDSMSTYKYYIHNYSGGEEGIKNSQAVINVYYGEHTYTFYPPNINGLYWKVFDIVDGQIEHCEQNCVENDSSLLRGKSCNDEFYLFKFIPKK